MEHFDLKTISSREKVLIINLNNIDEIIVSNFLSALGKSKINIDSISLTNNDSTHLIIMINKKYETKIYKIFDQFNFDKNKILEKSSFEINGVGIRGENGYVLSVLNNFKKKEINLDFLVSGALNYEFYVKKDKFYPAYRAILSSMNLPNINFE